jgi:hypothetical protein
MTDLPYETLRPMDDLGRKKSYLSKESTEETKAENDDQSFCQRRMKRYPEELKINYES